MLNGHKGEAKQEKNLGWGATTQVSAVGSRSLRPIYSDELRGSEQ